MTERQEPGDFFLVGGHHNSGGCSSGLNWLLYCRYHGGFIVSDLFRCPASTPVLCLILQDLHYKFHFSFNQSYSNSTHSWENNLFFSCDALLLRYNLVTIKFMHYDTIQGVLINLWCAVTTTTILF